jgi:hypothetical protein
MAKGTIVYEPPGGERTEWAFDEDMLTGQQFVLIEDALDITADEWGKKLERGSLKALLALWWVVRRDAGEPELTWAELIQSRIVGLDVITDAVDDGKDPKGPSPASEPTSGGGEAPDTST